ncbi:hypothetical protein TNCV_655311 [Trichonephila clavipes]|nr:hypothetical protein TNCV_655311 [Trichonephila clavipes]
MCPKRLCTVCLETVAPVAEESGRDSSDAVHRLFVLAVTAKYRSSFGVVTRGRPVLQQYGKWNWRCDPSQQPDTITGSRFNVYSPQLPLPYYHHPFFSLQRPTIYPRNQRLPQRPTVLRPDAPTF